MLIWPFITLTQIIWTLSKNKERNMLNNMKVKFDRNRLLEKYHQVNWKTEILAGLTVALALIPESIAFAFVAGVSPILSLQTAVVYGLVTSLFTGRPGMINSSTAAISVVMAALVASHGLEYLFAAVVLMGIIQLLIGILKLGKFARMIPYPVMLGFLNGLSLVILTSQFDLFKINSAAGRVWIPGFELSIMLFFVALTMAIIHFLPKLTKAIPSSLMAIIILTIIAVSLDTFTGFHLQTVRDFAGMPLQGGLPQFHIPQVSLNYETFQVILPYALIAALVGLTEAVLTLRVIDEMTETKGNTNKEIVAQGLGNLVTGFFGGMGGDAMIGQSIVNIKSGGRTRVSSLAAPLFLLLFIMFGSTIINVIPLAALVGVMFMVVIGTFKWESLKYNGKIPQQDMIVMLSVTVITIFSDLATAVIIGVVLSALAFAWKKGTEADALTIENNDGSKTYKLNGSVFFGSVLNFQDLFTPNEDPNLVIFDFEKAKIMDYSGVEAINSMIEKYDALEKKVILRNVGGYSHSLIKNAKEITSIKKETIEVT